MRKALLMFVTLLAVLPAGLQAEDVEFSYSGRVRVDGGEFNGVGQFKFALVVNDASSPSGLTTYWSNDNSSSDGDEPAAGLTLDINRGFFSVPIGDTNAGMSPLDAGLFNSGEPLLLRVWFSDGVHGFERLAPDRRIVNPHLIGSQSFRDMTIYVNPATGRDVYPGLHPSRPKKTIQAAWNSLPPIVRRNVTIQLADGVYREHVLAKGKTAVGNTKISIIGNPASPSSVRITGSDAANDTLPLRLHGIEVVNELGFLIQGILFDYVTNHGLYISEHSIGEVKDCQFKHNGLAGSLVGEGSFVTYTGIEAADGFGPSSRGIQVQDYAFIVLDGGSYHDLPVGVVNYNGKILFKNSHSFTNNGTGIITNFLGSTTFPTIAGLVSFTGHTIAVEASLNSIVINKGLCTYTGNTNDLVSATGAQFIN